MNQATLDNFLGPSYQPNTDWFNNNNYSNYINPATGMDGQQPQTQQGGFLNWLQNNLRLNASFGGGGQGRGGFSGNVTGGGYPMGGGYQNNQNPRASQDFNPQQIMQMLSMLQRAPNTQSNLYM